MAQEVLLVQSVPGLGEPGEIVRVTPGYARNYLVPRELAVPVTDANRKMIERKKQIAEAARAKAREEARQVAAQLEKLKVTIPVKAGADDKLFGSVTSMDVAEALKKQGVQVEKQQIDLPEPIRELGAVKVPVRLHADVRAEVTVTVEKE